MPDDLDWLGPATDLLKEHGLDEAARALTRARGSREVETRFHPGVDREWPAIRDAVLAWVADPAPKLDGLLIAVGPGPGPDVEIIMQRGVGDRRWRELSMLDVYQMSQMRLDIACVVGMYLETMHRRMIEAIRHPGGQS